MGATTISVQGHRGARGARPENTLAAFQYALEVGVDIIELDLGVTKDDVLVVTHDPIINSSICLGPKGAAITKDVAVRSLNFSELSEYDCGSLANPRFPDQKRITGEKIPSLRAVFEFVRSSKLPAARTVKFNIEAKLEPGKPELTLGPKDFAKKIFALVTEFNFEDRVIVQSFDHRVLQEIRKLSQSLQISALFGGNLLDYALVAKQLQANFVSPNLYWITKKEVAELHAVGVKVSPWTANSEAEWRMLVDMGVDSIITDFPKELIAYLRANKSR